MAAFQTACAGSNPAWRSFFLCLITNERRRSNDQSMPCPVLLSILPSRHLPPLQSRLSQDLAAMRFLRRQTADPHARRACLQPCPYGSPGEQRRDGAQNACRAHTKQTARYRRTPAAVAQWAERLICNQQAEGSSPSGSFPFSTHQRSNP